MSDPEWYYRKGEQRFGPVSGVELKILAAEGVLRPEDMLRCEGTTTWIPATTIKGLFAPPTTATHRSAASSSGVMPAVPPTPLRTAAPQFPPAKLSASESNIFDTLVALEKHSSGIYPPPDTPTSAPPEPTKPLKKESEKTISIMDLALAHRRVMNTLTFGIAMAVVPFAIAFVIVLFHEKLWDITPDKEAAWFYVFSLVCCLFWIAGAVAGILLPIFLGILAHSLGHDTTTSVCYGAMSMIPLVGLVLLVILHCNAISHLRKAGYHPGFFGLDPATIRRY